MLVGVGMFLIGDGIFVEVIGLDVVVVGECMWNYVVVEVVVGFLFVDVGFE